MKFHKNFLDSDLLKEIHDFIRHDRDAYKWRTSHFWDQRIKRNSSPIAIKELPKIFFKPIHKRFDLPIKHLMLYVWPPGSYIGWHADLSYTFGATIYLNKKWDINHGGIFLYDSGKGLKARLPQYNGCYHNHDKTFHCISMTTPDAPLRQTLQVFGKETK